MHSLASGIFESFCAAERLFNLTRQYLHKLLYLGVFLRTHNSAIRCRKRENRISGQTHLASCIQDFAGGIKHALYPRFHPVDIRGVETMWRHVLFTIITVTVFRRGSRVRLFGAKLSMRTPSTSHSRCLEDVKPNPTMTVWWQQR